MGLAEVLRRDPVEVASRAVLADDERERRRCARRRIDLYQDNCEPILRQEIERAFKAPEVKARLYPFMRMACAHSLFKRVVDEIAKHTYNPPPTRFFEDEQDERAYKGLAREMRLNAKLDLSVRLTRAANHTFLFPRVNQRLGAVLDVMDASQVTVIPDPADPCRALALIYDTIYGDEIHHVYWDDVITFTFTHGDTGRILDARGRKVTTVRLVEPPTEHGYGLLPVVEVRLRESWGQYWDATTGQDLENAQLAVALLTALVLKLHKSQGERQIVVQGDTHAMSFPQVLDGEGAIVAPPDTSITALDLRSEATHYTTTIEALMLSVSAAYGISRERLNAQATQAASDVALLERRAETIRVFHQVEHDLVRVMARLSQAHPTYKMTAEPSFAIDFHEMEVRLSLKDQLEIWDEMERHGLHSPVDSIRALNPEITSDEEAWGEFRRNLDHRAEKIRLLRELNAPEDIGHGPGNSPEVNGALGPQSRGGEAEPQPRIPDGVDQLAFNA